MPARPLCAKASRILSTREWIALEKHESASMFRALTQAFDAQQHNRWFETAWKHYRSPKNGLRSGALIAEAEPCAFLAFEDFGTTGLTGDRSQYQPIEGQTNAFFNFFRAEGKTDKGGDDRGRWGVGQ